jgi:hypothetical protein
LSPIETFRFIGPSSFLVKYYFNSLNSNNRSNTVCLKDESVHFIELLVDQSSNGGTIYLSFVNSLTKSNKTSHDYMLNEIQIRLHVCVLFNSRQYKDCSKGYKLVTQTDSFGELSNLQLNIAYPMIGKWFIAMWKECTNQLTRCVSYFLRRKQC